MRPKRASSKARTFSGLSGSGRASCLTTCLTLSAKFFESLLLVLVGFLMPRPARLELDLASSEKLTDTIGMRILDTSLLQKLIGLSKVAISPFFMASWSS
jgi:hypothetical protein